MARPTFELVNLKDGEFHLENFYIFQKSEEFQQLTKDWEQVTAMRLDEVNDRESFDRFYDLSMDMSSDNCERQIFLLLEMYASKYKDLITRYPTVLDYAKFVLGICVQRSVDCLAEVTNSESQPLSDYVFDEIPNEAMNASSENLYEKHVSSRDALYRELQSFFNVIGYFCEFCIPADFAVLFINDPPKISEYIPLYRGPPYTCNRIEYHKGLIFSFSRAIICQVAEDERIHIYMHLGLPVSLGNCITSVLPGKRLTTNIKGWELPTPYKLGTNKDGKIVDVRGLRIVGTLDSGSNEAKLDQCSLALCPLNYLNVIPYDTNDLDIRTFSNMILIWSENYGKAPSKK